MKRGNFHRLAVRLGLHAPAATRRTPSGTQPTAARAKHPADETDGDEDTPDSGR
jgi:hypothetical protein